MNSVIAQCPICHDHLNVTRLHCRSCDTTIEGQFTLGRLYQLTAEQLDFVEIFVRSEGKINRVGQELNMSYPAVRARLTDVIEALGYSVGDPSPAPVTKEDRQEILAQVSAGNLSAGEAIQLLRGE
jgi:hypothetical protein